MMMTAFSTLSRRLSGESRWMLALSALLLFGFGWLFVFVTARIEERIAEEGGDAFFDAETTSVDIQMRFWDVVPILLPVVVWAIAKGGGAVASEIERGTLDLTLSRPVPRWLYLFAQLLVAVSGLLVLAAALVLGNLAGMQANTLREPPNLLTLARPALNLAALGWAIYGVSLALSSVDVVRWRPNLLASTLVLAEFIAPLIGRLPSMEDYQKTLEQVSIFTAYNPLTAATGASEAWLFNIGLLAAIGLAGAVLAVPIFQYRDLPANA